MHRPTVVAAALISLAVWVVEPLAGQARNPATEPITVRGRVVVEETGEAIANARVTISGTPVSVRTNLEGRFAIAAPRTATLAVTKASYLRAEVPVTAATDIRMTRAAVISGRVVDDAGDPVVGASVGIAVDKSGAFILDSVRASTDDRGEYRIGGLAPNAYVVSVVMLGPGFVTRTTGNGIEMIGGANLYTTYFPDTTDRDSAMPVSLRPGDERGDIDFHLLASRVSPIGLPMRGVPSALAVFLSAGSASISGSITSASGRPLRARVAIYGADARSNSDQVTTSTEDGRYEFSGLAAGTYRVAAARPGFSMSPDRLTPYALATLGVPATVSADQELDNVDLELVPWGAISGHVFDEAGEPVEGAPVSLMVVRYERGRRRLVPTSGPLRTTDDRGHFRIYSVPPGQYVLAASVSDTLTLDLAGYGRTYFPGTGAASEARLTTVRLGEEVGDLDFGLVAAPTVNISGRLVNAAGEPTTGGRFELIPRSHPGRIGARITPDGSFTFRNVPPGQYVMQADRGRLAGWREGEFAAFPVTVAGTDISGLLVRTSPGSRVRGRVIFDSATSVAPDPRSVTISPIPSDYDLAPSSIAMGDPDAESRFELRGITGSRRLQVTRVPAGWTVKAILSDGRDITDEIVQFGREDQSLDDVEVVLSDRLSQVIGRVTDDRSRAVGNASVIVFSADRTRWYPASRFMRSAATAADGSFKVTGLPTGSYFVAAVLTTPAGDAAWGDPVFLEGLRATSPAISIVEGQPQSVTLRVSKQ